MTSNSIKNVAALILTCIVVDAFAKFVSESDVRKASEAFVSADAIGASVLSSRSVCGLSPSLEAAMSFSAAVTSLIQLSDSQRTILSSLIPTLPHFPFSKARMLPLPRRRRRATELATRDGRSSWAAARLKAVCSGRTTHQAERWLSSHSSSSTTTSGSPTTTMLRFMSQTRTTLNLDTSHIADVVHADVWLPHLRRFSITSSGPRGLTT